MPGRVFQYFILVSGENLSLGPTKAIDLALVVGKLLEKLRY